MGEYDDVCFGLHDRWTIGESPVAGASPGNVYGGALGLVTLPFVEKQFEHGREGGGDP